MAYPLLCPNPDMESNAPTFSQILEASLEELRYLILQDNFADLEHKNYAEILKFYLGGDAKSLAQKIEKLRPGSSAFLIAVLRLQILQNALDEAQLSSVERLANVDEFWSGEAAFVLGWAYMRFQRNEDAKRVFKIARPKLAAIGAKKKSVKALLNIVVAESRLDSSRKLLGDYEIVAKEANKVGDPIVEGICHQNICKEFHLVGALEIALKYSNSALELLKQDSGALHFYETVLQRCHILIDLNRFREAYADFERAKVSTHPHIVEALKCIENLLGAQKTIKKDFLEPTWRDKLATLEANLEKKALTKSEMLFIELLLSREIERDEITTALYGRNIDWESAKNRFKVFLTRFRKKYPNLIVEQNGKISIADTTVLAQFDIA